MSNALHNDAPVWVRDTARLCLRQLTAQDEKLYCDLYTDADTMCFIGPPLAPGHAAKSFRAALKLTHDDPPKRLFFAIAERRSRHSLGIAAIQQFDVCRRRLEVGIIIGAWGRHQGYGKETIAALVSHAFEEFPIDKVWALTAVNHSAANALFAGIGFRRRGIVAATQRRLRQNIWSVNRVSWPRKTTTTLHGEY